MIETFASPTAIPWSLLTRDGIAVGHRGGIIFLATWGHLMEEATISIRAGDIMHVEALETADALERLANTLRIEVEAAHRTNHRGEEHE